MFNTKQIHLFQQVGKALYKICKYTEGARFNACIVET